MRYDDEAYLEVFPRPETKPEVKVETPIETFMPSVEDEKSLVNQTEEETVTNNETVEEKGE